MEGIDYKEKPMTAAEMEEEAEEKVETGLAAPGGIDKMNDHLSNIEQDQREQGRQAGRGTRISNPEEIKPTAEDMRTEINFNQNIDGEKKRQQFILDESIRTYAVVLAS
ncbi:unnamed protein product [marine sediment metagenome]|uniref:Uncharacterized protein n=1 Tax=marine sediment metagenome TaxID=412755 RepID=X1KLP0_9ZZZZ